MLIIFICNFNKIYFNNKNLFIYLLFIYPLNASLYIIYLESKALSIINERISYFLLNAFESNYFL